MLMITPFPRGIMCRSAARVQRKVPFSVTSKTICHCTSVMSTMFAVPPRPALFTATSRWPYSLIAVSKRRCTSSSCVTSAGTPRTPSSDAVSSRRRSCLSLMITLAPSSRQRFAVATPIPAPAAAVIKTILPSSRLWPGTGSGIARFLLARKHRTVLGRCPERGLQREAALQPDVKIVLPREADAGVALQGFRVRQRFRARRCNLGDARRHGCVGEIACKCVGREPRCWARVFDRGVNAGKLVLHRLERADGLAELLAIFHVIDRHLEQLASDAELGYGDRSCGAQARSCQI